MESRAAYCRIVFYSGLNIENTGHSHVRAGGNPSRRVGSLLNPFRKTKATDSHLSGHDGMGLLGLKRLSIRAFRLWKRRPVGCGIFQTACLRCEAV
ncbi:hypothetical protein NEIELOOT_00152 [Neisseria elongata subsp. glycolytica ATCC 29315]|uniref:Uncharacterized protein n=1 Tax=Neisseria elongata subsp. glycolytica ATCC 29315 TaxID=546263 RepID=D4DM89_NEIEG|nr:hypothetical protein NEIELOOT_00152 [Neisseria elongata subsp. glycolytica ATCC 29315]